MTVDFVCIRCTTCRTASPCTSTITDLGQLESPQQNEQATVNVVDIRLRPLS